MTGASRRLLGAVLASAALFGSAATAWGQRGQQPMVLNGPDAPPGPPAKHTPAPPAATDDSARESAAAQMDLLTLFFIIACLAGGVIAVLVAARVYDRFRVDNPIIAAVNDPWVQNKIAQELAAKSGAAAGEVELTAADARPPSHH
ncbi:MAG TPA: hypothetical protein VFG68_09080 [Fimbriiglobus sp.]|nr:hypothetical protein [Fimbriiglobus sp.]